MRVRTTAASPAERGRKCRAARTTAARRTMPSTMIARTRRFAEDHPVIWLLVLGTRMGSRAEFSEPWQQHLMTAEAPGAVLCLTIAPMRLARAGR